MNIRKQLDDLITKENAPLLEDLNEKERKAFKKTLQAAEPSEYFGQDFTKLGELIDRMRELKLVKADKTLNKKMKIFTESNTDIVATAAKLRKQYELLYEQLRSTVYPSKKGDLR
jgi:cell division protein FtsB